MDLNQNMVETEVDALLRRLKRQGPTDIKTLAKQIKTSPSVIEKWANFLMEEGVITIEYRFTTPYLYLTEDKDKVSFFKEKEYSQEEQDKKVREYDWKTYIVQLLEDKKSFFYKEAERRNLTQVDKLWEEYKGKVLDEL